MLWARCGGASSDQSVIASRLSLAFRASPISTMLAPRQAAFLKQMMVVRTGTRFLMISRLLQSVRWRLLLLIQILFGPGLVNPGFAVISRSVRESIDPPMRERPGR